MKTSIAKLVNRFRGEKNIRLKTPDEVEKIDPRECSADVNKWGKHLDDRGTIMCCPECKTPLWSSGRPDFPYKCPSETTPCGQGVFSADYLCQKLGYVLGPTCSPATNAAKADSTNPKDRIGDTKPDLSLVPPALLIHTAGVMALGAKKYGAYNWRSKKVRNTVYVAAALRHLMQYLDGDDNDAESGFSHLAHAAACCGIVLDAQSCPDALVDDRPKSGPASKLITRFTKKP